MTEEQFWNIIERAKDVPDEEKAEVIQSYMQNLSLEELAAFAVLFSERLAESYHWPLWGAAYLINGGSSDDGFDYFRGWLILQGRDVFKRAIANPDWLAGYIDPAQDDFENEDALLMADRVYAAKTGQELLYEPEKLRAAYQAGPRHRDDWDFDDEDECRKRLPRLSALYLEADE